MRRQTACIPLASGLLRRSGRRLCRCCRRLRFGCCRRCCRRLRVRRGRRCRSSGGRRRLVGRCCLIRRRRLIRRCGRRSRIRRGRFGLARRDRLVLGVGGQLRRQPSDKREYQAGEDDDHQRPAASPRCNHGRIRIPRRRLTGGWIERRFRPQFVVLIHGMHPFCPSPRRQIASAGPSRRRLEERGSVPPHVKRGLAAAQTAHEAMINDWEPARFRCAQSGYATWLRMRFRRFATVSGASS